MAKWKATANNKTGDGKFTLPPPGNTPAVCVAMVDLGTHDLEFTDKKTGALTHKDYRKVFLVWELTRRPDPGFKDRNYLLSREYSVALGSNAALRGVVETAMGRKLADQEDVDDLAEVLLGMECLIDVEHGVSKGGKDFAAIKTISSLPEGFTNLAPRCEAYLYDMDSGRFDPPKWLPRYSFGQKIEDVMAASNEARGVNGTSPNNDYDRDDEEREARPPRKVQQRRPDALTDAFVASVERSTKPTSPDEVRVEVRSIETNPPKKLVVLPLPDPAAKPPPAKPTSLEELAPAQPEAEVAIEPPPPLKKLPIRVLRRWWVYADGEGEGKEPSLMDEVMLAQWANAQTPTKGAEDFEVCPEDGSGTDYRTAAAYGLNIQLPF